MAKMLTARERARLKAQTKHEQEKIRYKHRYEKVKRDTQNRIADRRLTSKQKKWRKAKHKVEDLGRQRQGRIDPKPKKKGSWWSRFKGRYLSKRTARTQDVKRQVPGMKTDAERRAARKKK